MKKDEIMRRSTLFMNKVHECERLKAKLAERDKQIAAMNEHTWCAYCGHEIYIDDEAATKISEHIMFCEKHPIHIAFAEIEKQREKIATLTTENTTLKAEVMRLTGDIIADFMSTVLSSRKLSNVYEVRISTERVQKWQDALKEKL